MDAPIEEPRGKPVILETHDLAKSFDSAAGPIHVLRRVDLQLLAGESLSIRGESGSGKSTLLNLVSGLEYADSGTIRWEDQELKKGRVGKHPLERLRGKFIGFVFQAYYLMPELNALENVLMAARMIEPPGKAERERARELLERVGLGERERQLPSSMSGGERQRIAVARALVNRPRVVLADEPTGNLDERTGRTVMDLLLKVTAEEKAGLLLVTHNPEFAMRTQRRAFLRNGLLEE